MKKRKNPRSRRMLMHKLRWLSELDMAGDRVGAQRVFMSLPIEARGVLALLIYAGRYRNCKWRTRERYLMKQEGLR